MTISQDGENSTLERLLHYMRGKRDFPALSNIISEINQIVSSESESSTRLARTILQDMALTSRLLQQVNTATYGQFGGTINTVSKAVVILGFETVRNISMSLILMDFIENSGQAESLRDEVVQAILTGVVATQLARGVGDAEELMVCAMFHNLGRMLATYYFFEDSRKVAALMAQGGSEAQAATTVLGLSYTELGLAVARSWNFPPRLLAGMRKLPATKPGPIVGELEQLTVTVNLANTLCEMAASGLRPDKHQVLRDLAKRYECVGKMSERDLSAALDAGLADMARRSGNMGVNLRNSPLLARVTAWCGHAMPTEAASKPEAFDALASLNQAVSQSVPDIRPAAAEEILGLGIQDITTSLVSDFNLNDVLQMVLETIYRGIGFHRAVILIKDRNDMVAKFGFGPGIEALIPKFRFALPFVADVFHLSLAKGLDIAIEDINAGNIADKIPGWYRETLNAPCFMLLPILLQDKAIGMFYADMLTTNGLKLSPQQLSLLRTLRNQAVLAIKQKI